MPLEPSPDRPAQRATDADRDHVFTVLREAHADGRLDRAELDERLDQVSASKTRTELADITADLQAPAPDERAGDQVVFRSTGSPMERSGSWSVPAQIVVEAKHASIRLDFTSAVVRHLEVLIDLDCRHTSVKLTVPRGWRVTTNDLTSEWSKVKDQTESPTTAGVELRIAGLAKHSSVLVRHARHRRGRSGR